MCLYYSLYMNTSADDHYTLSLHDALPISGVHYRPRYRGDYRRASRSSSQSQGVSQVHAGFFDPDGPQNSRSEEHTSELQSRFDIVCRLLLEKKIVYDIVAY